MGNCKLLLVVGFLSSMSVTNVVGLEWTTSTDSNVADSVIENRPEMSNNYKIKSWNTTNVADSAMEKRHEIVHNDTIKALNSTNIADSAIEKRSEITANETFKFQNLKQITNVSMDDRQDVTANTTETNDPGLMDTAAGFDTNSVSGSSTSHVVGKLADVESCRHKCGQIQKLPCSCDLRCLVYKNCCEDMLTECPDVVEETRIKYGHLLNVKVECSKTDSLFVIADCGSKQPFTDALINLSASRTSAVSENEPNSLTTRGPFFPSTANPTEESFYPKPTSSMRKSLRFNDSDINALMKDMSEAYVTDTTTGFTFKNMDIFSCNALQNSVPAIWGTVYSSRERIRVNYSTLARFSQEITSYQYSAPSELRLNQNRTTCLRGVRSDCKNSVDSNLQRKCQEFISYVEISAMYFSNKYCALCINNTNFPYEKLIPVTNYYPFFDDPSGFKLTFSEQSVTIDIYGETDLAWQRVECRLPERDPIDSITSEIPCVVVKCSKYSVLRQQSICKFSFFTTMAVADDTFPLTRREYQMYPKFARCFLELVNNVDFDGDFTPTFAIFDHRYNKTVYTTEFFYYSEIEHSDIIQNVMTMAKVFKLYRSTRPRTPHTFTIKHSIFSVASFSVENLPPYTADNPNNATACFCTEQNPYTPTIMRLPCVISCLQDNVDVQAVSKYLGSPCFSVFNESTGRARNVQFNVASIFVLVAFQICFNN